VPASASLSIAAIAEQVDGVQLPDPVVLVPTLTQTLEQLTDPRKPRGMRHGLAVVLSVAVCAVAAGARSFVAIAEWVVDLPLEAAIALGVDRRCPSESAIRRLVGRLDADRFDTVIGAFVQRLCAVVAPTGRRRVFAVDGKTLRGSRRVERDGTIVAGRHLLAVIDQRARVVLGQVQVTTKSNEITAPQVMATLRNLVISLHRLAGATNIAAALRHHAWNPHRPLTLLKIT
jgi:hypothetical protein